MSVEYDTDPLEDIHFLLEALVKVVALKDWKFLSTDFETIKLACDVWVEF